MFGTGQLIRCQQHKAALLQRSATHRRVLRAEAQKLRPVAGWVDLGLDAARQARAGWSVLAPLLSLWQTRRQESSGLVGKWAEALALIRAIAAWWRK